jgi:hypothetical protein
LKKKKVLSILLCLLISGSILAQERKVLNLPNFDNDPYHFGFILGLNQMFFTVKPKDGYTNVVYNQSQLADLTGTSAHLLGVESNSTTGFVIGIVSNLRMGERFDLRFIPSLSFGERQILYRILISGDSLPIVITKPVQSTFVEFPLYIRYKGKRINNVRPHIFGGAKYAIDLASNSKKRGNSTDYNVAIQRNDLYAELGVGFDFYTAWFKFGTELKMSYGLRDILKHDNTIYTDGIQQMNSRLFQLTFSFE